MTAEFKRKKVNFTLKDIGSSIIDQLSSDIYSGPESIMRELVKNAYDSYLGVSADELEDEGCEREIVISRDRDANGIGRILIADHGIGQTLSELKSFLQISISRKKDELEQATGFRGLGSWATLGAGSKITITATKKGHKAESRLVIDVRKIYGKMGPNTTLDDILNDAKCISFEERAFSGNTHGTTLEIECDGPPEAINGHELNRLYEYTDPSSDKLRGLLVQTCPIPFSSEGGAHKQIYSIYSEAGYIPTQVVLDGDQLERRLPSELSEITEFPIHLASGSLAAKAWVAEDPKQTGEVRKIDESKQLLGGPSIQLMKLNVPIGPKGIFNKGIRNASLLKWYVGEVHILLDDVLPDAGGQGLRAGTARSEFIEALQRFYAALEDRAETKSIRINKGKKLRQSLEAARRLSEEKALPEREQISLKSAIIEGVKVIEETSAKTKPKEIQEALKDSDFQELRKQARRLLKSEGYLQDYGSPPKRPTAKGKKATASSRVSGVAKDGKNQRIVNLDAFQAKIGQAVPKFEEIGLSTEQINQVLAIINEVVLGES